MQLKTKNIVKLKERKDVPLRKSNDYLNEGGDLTMKKESVASRKKKERDVPLKKKRDVSRKSGVHDVPLKKK